MTGNLEKQAAKFGPPYARPPITEAVIDVRFTSPVAVVKVEKALKKVRALYDHVIVERNIDLRVDVNETSAKASVDQELMIYRLTSKDQTQIALLSTAAVTVSQLAPYPSWDHFFARFKRDWELWKDAAGPNKIQRIGVRYINRIDIPIGPGRVEIGDYVRLFIEYPESMGQASEYGFQVKMLMPKINSSLIVNSAIVRSPLTDHFAVVLDFDFSPVGELPQRDDDLYALLISMRDAKNFAFETSITDASRELFSE